ncbi:unnamed protein product [Chrysoparadoxa australica]
MRLIVLVVALSSLLLAQGFVAPPSHHVTTSPASRLSTSRLYAGSTITEATTDAEFQRAADFFCANFWAGGEKTVSPGVERQLAREQYRDMRVRYGEMVGAKKLKTALFLAKDSDGEIIGCAGLEVNVCRDKKFGLRFQDQGDDTKLRPLLSNLVVFQGARKQGLGKQLTARCEKEARSWGYTEVLLLVDEENKAARKLYQKCGYRQLFRNTEGSRLDPFGRSVTNAPTTLLCLRKDLNNPFSWFF